MDRPEVDKLGWILTGRTNDVEEENKNVNLLAIEKCEFVKSENVKSENVNSENTKSENVKRENVKSEPVKTQSVCKNVDEIVCDNDQISERSILSNDGQCSEPTFSNFQKSVIQNEENESVQQKCDSQMKQETWNLGANLGKNESNKSQRAWIFMLGNHSVEFALRPTWKQDQWRLGTFWKFWRDANKLFK